MYIEVYHEKKSRITLSIENKNSSLYFKSHLFQPLESNWSLSLETWFWRPRRHRTQFHPLHTSWVSLGNSIAQPTTCTNSGKSLWIKYQSGSQSNRQVQPLQVLMVASSNAFFTITGNLGTNRESHRALEMGFFTGKKIAPVCPRV